MGDRTCRDAAPRGERLNQSAQLFDLRYAARLLSVLELFCGIGGCAAALGERARIVAAVDQNRVALRAYSMNFPARTYPLAIESVPDTLWREWEADLWWMSPPCQPFTTRGLRRDLADPRTRGLSAVVRRLAVSRPRYVAMENVPGFVGSRTHARLRDALDDAGYTVRETVLCPTSLGLPNRRQRYYLVAARDALAEWPAPSGSPVALSDLIDQSPAPALWCDPELATRYGGALDVVDAHDATASTACFTAAYGRSPVRSGSYLATPSGLRRFSPAEILRVLDFPASYRLPDDLALRRAWALVGNSVSVRAIRWVLSAIACCPAPHPA